MTAQGSRILVVEDQPANWMLADRLLAERGHDAVNAVDGRQAIDWLDIAQFDLVLMDCQMPVLDGVAATREIRRRELLGAPRISIVAMTAGAAEWDRERCLAAGMDDYVTKPLTGAVIDQILARWLPTAPERTHHTLDPGRLDELRMLFGNEAAAVIAQLRSEVEVQLERARVALAAGDGAEATDAAHRLRSSALMVGAGGLADSAAALQMTAVRDLEAARRIGADLRRRWVEVGRALDAAQVGGA
jgi:two-component system, sensor histidine kinase and response regulator